MVTRTTIALALSAALGLCLPGCDSGEPEAPPMRMEVRALGSGACGPASVVNPFSDMNSVRIRVTGLDADTEEVKTLVNRSFSLSGQSLKVTEVPEGKGHTLEFFGTGKTTSWYSRALNLNVVRQSDTPVQLLLTEFGKASQVPVPTDFSDVIFSAAVTLGDGRVMVSGGFQTITNTEILGPSDKWFIFNPKTGEIDAQGNLGAPRGAHAMAFLPTAGAAGKVLIVGGAKKLIIDEAQSFPLRFSKSDGAEQEALLFDLQTLTVEAIGGAALTMRLGRAFPRVAVLSDGMAAVSGGGEWPIDNDPAFKRVEIFNPKHQDGPRFITVSSFDTFSARAGHSVTFIKTQDGLAYYLVWGGTAQSANARIAEVLRQSSRQADGVDGNFVEIAVTGDPVSWTYFHQVTPLDGQRFLVTGGVPFASDALGPPESDAAWLLTYQDDNGQNPRIAVKKVPGLGTGRVLHSATSFDGRHAVVVGGFDGLKPTEADVVMFFDGGEPVCDAETGACTYTEPTWSVSTDAVLPRGGQAALSMESGSTLLVGGADMLRQQAGPVGCALVEVYTPSSIPRP
jgi:hypothetical protein